MFGPSTLNPIHYFFKAPKLEERDAAKLWWPARNILHQSLQFPKFCHGMRKTSNILPQNHDLARRVEGLWDEAGNLGGLLVLNRNMGRII